VVNVGVEDFVAPLGSSGAEVVSLDWDRVTAPAGIVLGFYDGAPSPGAHVLPESGPMLRWARFCTRSTTIT